MLRPGSQRRAVLVSNDIEDELFDAAMYCGLADDGERECWATTRSSPSAGLQQPID